VEILPDLGSLSDTELKALKNELEEQEHELSFQRRIVHGKIDILRAEIVARLKQSEGEGVLEPVDVEHLTAILTRRHDAPE
jgi:GTP-sensing pleiotropic transcriptional regulator CodY